MSSLPNSLGSRSPIKGSGLKKSSSSTAKDYHGRIYMFSQKDSNDSDTSKIKQLIEQSGGDISEIKVDGKPYLQSFMKKILGEANRPPHVFFNDEYVGGWDQIKAMSENGQLGLKIQTCKNALSPGELYKIYRKQGDLFVISPGHLYFPPPTKRLITCLITLYNRTDKYTAYKLKTTCPNRYIVKPKKGIAPPNGTVHVEITMQKPVTENEKGDKFRVESLALQYYKTEMEDKVDELFKEADTKRIVKQKISCLFESPPSVDFNVVSLNDGSVIVSKNISVVDIYDGFPIEQFAQAVTKQRELINGSKKPQLSIHTEEKPPQLSTTTEAPPVNNEHVMVHSASATSPITEAIFESPRNSESTRVLETEELSDIEKSPIPKSDSSEDETSKIQELKSASEKIVAQKTSQKMEASKGLEELYKEEYNRLEKEYEQIINKLKTSEQRIKEYELTIDELHVKLRESEQALQRERAQQQKRRNEGPIFESLGRQISTPADIDAKEGYSLAALITIALICLLIGKLM
ncbi:hypothetical protein C9374_013286 [Naegleria lovaniensis]|uniref:MSP domain-containing protein n=1 Tax=Naegleria lovaniensis TaxID=51637 RepID=A0AA88H0A2_NAELO|nr:uncharacterized protein C9374_013286 [Naegleria lovaniensis]KAG2391801.1 hypothetical protein C9374_013286 [Naegleria lovaniensis]